MLMIMQFQFQVECQKVDIPNRNVFLKISENASRCIGCTRQSGIKSEKSLNTSSPH